MTTKDHPTLESSAILRELVNRLREGIYVTNRDGTILDANPAFLDLFGLSSLDDLAELTVEDLVVDADRRQAELEILERDGAVRDFELTIRRLDGEIRTVLDTAYAVPGATDDVIYNGILIDITDRKELEQELRDQAIRDPLTGCFNRRYLRLLAGELDPSDRSWGAVVIDIDHFKRVNDLHGHQAGDEILVKTARFLSREVRAEDAVIRYGGDEFLLLLGDADRAVAKEIADRLLEAAPEHAPSPFSMGWASRKGREPLEKTIGRADRNLIRIRFEVRGHPTIRRTD